MKKSTPSLPVILGIGFLTTFLLAASPSSLAQKIDVLGLAARGDATLTATTWDLGNVTNCFDGDIYSMMRSANIHPAFVQVSFTELRSVQQIRVLLGEPDYPDINSNSWWVETADSQADMDSQSGSYQLLVARRDDVNGVWDQMVLPQAVEAKLWKFTIERTVGDDYVHIPELQLWSGEDHFPDSDIAGFQLIDANTDQPLMGLTNGATVNNQGLSESLAIEVLTDQPVGSVKIRVAGPGINTSKNESAAPYASFGDDNGDFDGEPMGVGVYEVTATPYSGRNATGTPGISAQISFTIKDGSGPLDPVYEEIDPFMATPAAGAANIIPVLVIRFLPTEDGVNLDVSKVPDFWSLGEITLEDMKARIDLLDKRIKFMLEEGSKYHGYKDPNAQPMMGYKVVEYITVYEQSPAGKWVVKDKNGYPIYKPDYFQIFERFDVEHYVNDLGVKHIWLWDAPLDSSWPVYESNPEFFDPADFRGPPEANMASPTTGDISNSYRDNSDLPIYDHTYIVFGNNYRRTQNEAVGHNYGHQIEHMLKYNDLQDNNQEDLFWQKFVGADENLESITGRCGWNHMPPNTTENYDYLNPTLVESDIEDWRPDNSGEKKMVNVDTWRNLSYNWPSGTYINDTDERPVAQWHMYWMQALPGATANIPYQDDYVISDWWNIFANWDEVNNAGKLLYEEAQPSDITFRLIDADTDQAISGLTAGQSVPVPGLPRNLAIEVLTTESVGSFKIQVTGPGLATSKNESAAPYASFGDDSGDFRGRILEAGSYTVTATPYSGRNATGTAGSPAEISFTLGEDDNQPPVARFTATQSSITGDLTIFFDASGSSDEDGELTGPFHFDFGDGNSTISDDQASHTYTSEGEYTVTLTITDDQGATASTSLVVSVERYPGSGISGFNIIDAEQDVSISSWTRGWGYLASCAVPESLAIEVIPAGEVGSIKIEVEGPGISTSMIEHSAPFVSFGDEGDNILGMPFSEGTYYITATVYSGRDATGTASVPVEFELEIELTSPPSSDFTVTSTSGTAPLGVDFAAVTRDPFYFEFDYFVDFGDGRSGIIPDRFSHTYTQAGTYTVTLTVTENATGCSSSTSKTITVAPNPSPVAGFRLIDADTDQPFADITQGTEIETYRLPESLAIEALVSEPVGSLRIEVTGPGVNTARNQSDAPYSSFGDSNGDFAGMPLGEGDISYEGKAFTVKATPYSGRNATGTPGIPLEITFSIVEYGTYVWIGGITGPNVGGEYSHYNFYVNGEFQFDGDSEPIDYDDCIICDYKWTEVPISEIESVMVEFDNDLQTATEDRNLYISSIGLEPGDGFHPEDGNYYTLSLDPLGEGVLYDRGALDGVDVVPGTNVMDVNGFMIFPVETSDLARYGPRVTKSSPVAKNTFSEPASSAMEEGRLLIYPNPARGRVEVNLPLLNGQPYTLQVYDLYGREVFRQQGAGSVAESILLQGQPRGTYLVAVQTGGQRLVQKLLIED